MFRKGNFRVLAIFLLITVMFASDLGYTHPGRTDANGGHYNRKTGEYHKHVKEDSQPETETDTNSAVSQPTLTSDDDLRRGKFINLKGITMKQGFLYEFNCIEDGE